MLSGSVMLEHAYPTALIVAGGLAALAVAGYTFWRYLARDLASIVVTAVRVVFILMLVWCLLMPILRSAESERLRPRFLVAVDTTESMTLAPATNLPTRWSVAQGVLGQAWWPRVAALADIDAYPVAEELGAKLALPDVAKLLPTGKSTHLRDDLRKLVERYRGQNVGGLLLLTDGLDTREANDQWAGFDWPFPIYTVRPEEAGIWKQEPDVRVDSVETPRRVVAGWDTELKAAISGQGTGGRAVDVQLFENDKLIQTVPIDIADDGGSRETTFRLAHPSTGRFIYTVKLPILEGEKRTNDNSYAIAVQVIDSKNRLLYIEDVPRWESKYLVRTLKASKELVPICFVRGPGGKFLSYGTQSSAMPELTESQLLNFKVVIIGDLDAEALGAARAQSLLKYVETGGSLVLLGGAKGWGEKGFFGTPLAPLIPFKRQAGAAPVQEAEFAVVLTAEGRSHPAFLTDSKKPWETIPPVLSVFPAGGLTPGATALLLTSDQAGKQPVVVVQQYGQGKVVAVLTDSLWRWQLNPGQDVPYQKFWSQMLLWLTPVEEDLKSFQLELFADAERVFFGESVRLRSRLAGADNQPVKDAAVTCIVVGPDNRPLPFAMSPQEVTTASGKMYPGYGLIFEPPAPGLYQATAQATVGGKKYESTPFSFFIKPFTPESNPRPANFAVLSDLAQTSKGEFVEPDQLGDLLTKLEFKAVEEERVNYNSLWNHWLVIVCLIVVISVEWIYRKTHNMA